jgi:hypothetical protein
MRNLRALITLALSLAACGSVTPTTTPTVLGPTAGPSVATPNATTPSVGTPSPVAVPSHVVASSEPSPTQELPIVSATGKVRGCLSFGGCRYFLDVLRPGDVRDYAEFDYGSGGGLVLAPSAVPPLSTGRNRITASFVTCSDVFMNGVRECGPVVASCATSLVVRAGPGTIAIRAVFREASCTISVTTT